MWLSYSFQIIVINSNIYDNSVSLHHSDVIHPVCARVVQCLESVFMWLPFFFVCSFIYMMNVFILRNTLKRYWWLTVLCYLSLIFKKSGFFSVETILNWSNTQIYKMIIWVKNKLSVMKISVPKLYHDHQRLSGLWIVNLTHIFVTLWICYWCIRPLMCIYDSLWRERSVLLIDTKNIYMYINLWIIILNVYFVQFLLSLKFIWCHSFLLFVSFINVILVTYSWVSSPEQKVKVSCI